MDERDADGRSVLGFLYSYASDSRIQCLRALGDKGFPFGSFVDERDASALEEIVTRGFAQDLAFLREAGVAPGRIAPYRDNAVRWLVFAGILTGGSIGLILDSLDTSSHGWLRLPVAGYSGRGVCPRQSKTDSSFA